MDRASNNMLETALEAIKPIISSLARHPKTIGIVLLGGVGKRQYFDQHSDIDFAIFVEDGDASYLPPFSFYLNNADVELELNVTQHVYPTDDIYKTERWDEAKRSAYRNGQIVLDRDDRLKRLIDYCCCVPDDEYRDNAAIALNQIYWRGLKHSIAAWDRGCRESAHSLLNSAWDLAIQVIFCVNRSDRPHRKWIMRELSNLPSLPPGSIRLLESFQLIKSQSYSEFIRRLELARTIHTSLSEFAAKNFRDFPMDHYRHWARYRSGRQIDQSHPIDLICDFLEQNNNAADVREIRGRLSTVLIHNPSSSGCIRSLIARDRLDLRTVRHFLRARENDIKSRHDSSNT